MGLSADRVDGLLARGWLHRVHRGVYATTPIQPAGRGQAAAALLTQRSGAVLSHRSAAALWDLRGWPSGVEITVDPGRSPSQRRGVLLHRGRLPREEVTRRDRLPVTTPARTLLDLAAIAPESLERAAGEAERRRLYDLNAIRAVLERHPRRRGSRALGALVSAQWLDLSLTRSELERVLLELCRRHHIELPAVNCVVEGHTVDFLWPRHRLVVETDGAESHLTRTAFEDDRVRDAELIAAGYRVVRFTHRRLTVEPGAVAAALRALLRRAPPSRCESASRSSPGGEPPRAR